MTENSNEQATVEIPLELYERLDYLGIIPNDVRKSNVGESNYSKHTIQPWSIWLDWDLNPWDADIIKRTLRSKTEKDRYDDYVKIMHICSERLRQMTKKNKKLPLPSTFEIKTKE